MPDTLIHQDQYPTIQDNYYKDKLTLQQIASRYGVSRERIRQILKKLNPEHHRTDRKFLNICHICGRGVYKTFKSPTFECTTCIVYNKSRLKHPDWRPRLRKHEVKACIICHKKRGNRKGVCGNCYVKNYLRTHPEAYARQQLLSRENYYRNHEWYKEYAKQYRIKQNLPLDKS